MFGPEARRSTTLLGESGQRPLRSLPSRALREAVSPPTSNPKFGHQTSRRGHNNNARQRPPGAVLLVRYSMAAIAVIGTIGALALVPCCMLRRSTPSRLMTAPWRRSHGAVLSAPGGGGRYIDSVQEAAQALRKGGLVAFPTETVYGLGAHAFDANAVARIFTVKGRPRSDPLIVHVPTAAAAEELVRLDADGLAVMRELIAAFWPGPLTLVAPACPELPSAVTANSGFVGVRCPAHGRAVELLRAAAIPVAAPSANRFGHVSPTQPEHVMDDLGAHDILVLRPEVAPSSTATATECCNVGIESTVLKIDAAARELLLLRRGGVPEAELARWLVDARSDFSLRIQPPKHAAPPPLEADRSVSTAGSGSAAASSDAAGGTAGAEAKPAAEVEVPSEEEGMQAPGMLLTHYAPDLPSFLLSADDLPAVTAASASASASAPAALALTSAVVLDYGGRLRHLQSAVLAYRDLSPRGDAAEAAAAVFEALRWSEAQAARGGRCVLLPRLAESAADQQAAEDAVGSSSPGGRATQGQAAEHEPALADRLYRAASGREARLTAEGRLLLSEPAAQ